MPSYRDPGDFSFLKKCDLKIRFTHLSSGRHAHFLGAVTDLKDQYTSIWNEEPVYGRMDPIATFQRTGRKISLSWQILNENKRVGEQNMIEIQRLISFLYPNYYNSSNNASTIAGGPLLALKYTNLVSQAANPGGLIGYLDGFTFDPQMDSGFANTEGENLIPTVINASINFTVLHTHKLGWRGAKRRVAQFPYGIASQIDKKADDDAQAAENLAQKAAEDAAKAAKAAAELAEKARQANLAAKQGENALNEQTINGEDPAQSAAGAQSEGLRFTDGEGALAALHEEMMRTDMDYFLKQSGIDGLSDEEAMAAIGEGGFLAEAADAQIAKIKRQQAMAKAAAARAEQERKQAEERAREERAKEFYEGKDPFGRDPVVSDEELQEARGDALGQIYDETITPLVQPVVGALEGQKKEEEYQDWENEYNSARRDGASVEESIKIAGERVVGYVDDEDDASSSSPSGTNYYPSDPQSKVIFYDDGTGGQSRIDDQD